MEREQRDAEAMRRRLYEPGASPTDLADYLHVAEAQRPAEPAPAPAEESASPPPGRSLRPFLIGGAVVAGAALLGAVLLTGGPPAPAATPTAVAAAPAPTMAGTEDANGSWTVTFEQTVVLDGGESDHARGSSVAEGPDRLRYTVSSDDTVAAIASRFQLCPADVLQALPYGFDPGELPAGTTLELTHLDANTC